jgi:hypothetical protein
MKRGRHRGRKGKAGCRLLTFDADTTGHTTYIRCILCTVVIGVAVPMHFSLHQPSAKLIPPSRDGALASRRGEEWRWSF